MKEIFDEMDEKVVDFWGLIKHGESITETLYIPEHIQSFFMVIRTRMLHSIEYRNYWETLPYYKSFEDVVHNYEIKLTQYFASLGYTYDVLANTEINDTENIVNNYIQYTMLPYEMISKRNFPFLKKKIIIHDTLTKQTQENIRQAINYIAQYTDYDVNLIWDSVIRTMDISDIQRRCNIQYINSESECVKNLKNVAIAVCVKNISAVESVIEYREKIKDICNVKIYSLDAVLREEYSCYGFQTCSFINTYKIFDDLRKYSYICILHDADMTSNIVPSCTGKSYFYSIWENLLKSKNHLAGIVERFVNEPRLGYLAPPKANHAEYFCDFAKGWDGKYPEVKEFLKSAGLGCELTLDNPPFSVSDNFWIRGEIVRNITVKEIDEKLASYLWIYFVQHCGYYAGIVETAEYASMNQINMQHYLCQITRLAEQLFGKFENFQEMKKKMFEAALHSFCNDNTNIMIYGTGGMTKVYSDILPNVSGYIVSDGQPKVDRIGNIPVRYLSEVEGIENIGIILCMLPKYQAQVLPRLEEKGVKNYICIY